MGHKLIDLTGQRFGRLMVVKRDQSLKGTAYWECVCDCGNVKIIASMSLRSGDTKSCGCFLRELKTKHGCNIRKNRSGAYQSWASMIQRCLNPNSDAFHNYGGRGVVICERWLDFANFLEDMGERPEKFTIERVDNNKGYEPGNCKWASRAEQSHNRRGGIFTERKIKRVRKLRSLGFSTSYIGKLFGTDRSYISAICLNKIWKEKD